MVEKDPTTAKWESLVDFVFHNVDALGTPPFRRWPQTKQVIEELFVRRASIERVVERVYASPFAVQLLELLAKQFFEDPRDRDNAAALGQAVFENRHAQAQRRAGDFRFARALDEQMVAIFQYEPVYEHLLRSVSVGELIDAVGTQFYWTHRVRRFVAGKDVERAFDELVKAADKLHHDDYRFLSDLLDELVKAVGGFAVVEAASPRKLVEGSRADRVRRNFRAFNDVGDEALFLMLRNYFGAVKNARRRK